MAQQHSRQPGRRTLHVFRHGLGDSLQLTAVLRHLKKHRPDEEQHVAALVGKHSAFFGLADGIYVVGQEPPHSQFTEVIQHPWPECLHGYHDMPSTKTCLCLRETFGITPEWDLLKYTIHVSPAAQDRADAYLAGVPKGNGYVVLHYEGNTSQVSKNLSHADAGRVCDFLSSNGYTAIILDWDRRTPLPDNKTVWCPDVENDLWQHTGTGDAEVIAALLRRASAVVAVDSGPQKVAFAVGVPTVAVWVGHSPAHYCDNAPDAVHVVPACHENFLRGDRTSPASFFRSRYKHVVYHHDVAAVVCQQVAGVLGLSVNPMAEGKGVLVSKSFGEDYYQQHRRAGLDYLGHGEWQEGYGRWLVDVLGLAGKTVLDVGCACGSVACGIAKAGALVSGVDVSEEMIRRGRLRWLADNLFVCDAVNLHYFPDATFDFLHSAQVFEHFKPELVPFVLRELLRVTRPGGVLFAALDTEELYRRQGRTADTEDATHVCVMPMAWWHDQLAAAGWVLDPEALERLKSHPGSYFRRYDWDAFCAKRPAN